MTELVTRSGAWLLQQAATLPDTVVMKTVATGRGWFETVTGIASGVMSITLVVLTIVVAPAAWEFWKTFKRARAVLDVVEADLGPLMRNARGLADRIGELNALLQVAQQEAEQAFVATASAVRGVRTGAATLGVLADPDDDDDTGDDDYGDDDGDDDDDSDEDALDAPQRRPARGESGAAARPRLRPKRRA